MFKEFLLGIVSLFPAQSDQLFYAEEITIPSGQSVIETPFEWNSVVLLGNEGTPLPKIWHQVSDTMHPWYNAEDHIGMPESQLLELLYVGTPRNKLIIKSEATVNVVAHFYNTHIEGENQVVFDKFDDDSTDDPRTGLAKHTPLTKRPKYITRAQWRADESLRVWKPSRGLSRGFRSSVPEAKNLARSLQPKVIQRTNSKNQRLTWPIEENQTIRKFIVHHTGEVTDETRDPYELMRAIYYYHTITRGWGDIGYNYVIDKHGNIYEGRAGGATTVGAHTAYYNAGTIGISLMGNFEYEQPTEKQLQVLKLVLADHTNRFRVDPTAQSYWLGTREYNVAGHRDVARVGHGTACPGRNLHALLPEIRTGAKALALKLKKTNQKSGVDFLYKSKAAPKIQRRVDRTKNKPSPVALAKLIQKTFVQRGKNTYLELHIRNNTDKAWKRGEKILVTNVPEGMRLTNFVSVQPISAGNTGIFRSRLSVKDTPNGIYQISLEPRISTVSRDKVLQNFTYPIQVSGDRSRLTQKLKSTNTIKKGSSTKSTFRPPSLKNSSRVQQPSSRTTPKSINSVENYGPDVKIKLSFFDENYAIITADKDLQVWSRNKMIDTIEAKKEARILPTNKPSTFKIVTHNREWLLQNPQFKTKGIITVKNYNRGLGNIPYNRFRAQINVHSNVGKDFYLVNELPLEQYLWGLAEEPSTEPDEKKHAIHVLARSYALVYAGTKRKFGTPFYDLEDDPASSQFYLGYDWEAYHHEQKALVNQTKGEVIMYEGRPVIGPYFTQSSGESSSKWVTQYPWTTGRKLPFDEGLEPRGHGVGLSGNSARVLAESGKTYKEILDYFYTGITTGKAY